MAGGLTLRLLFRLFQEQQARKCTNFNSLKLVQLVQQGLFRRGKGLDPLFSELKLVQLVHFME